MPPCRSRPSLMRFARFSRMLCIVSARGTPDCLPHADCTSSLCSWLSLYVGYRKYRARPTVARIMTKACSVLAHCNPPGESFRGLVMKLINIRPTPRKVNKNDCFSRALSRIFSSISIEFRSSRRSFLPMPIMTRMRDSMPIILFGLLIAFLITIVFEWGMDYLGMRGGQSDVVGVVERYEDHLQDILRTCEDVHGQPEGPVRHRTGREPDGTDPRAGVGESSSHSTSSKKKSARLGSP